MKKIEFLKTRLEDNLSKMFGVNIEDASVKQIYYASAATVNDELKHRRRIFNHKVKAEQARRVYYLSIEFLIGKSLKNNLYNLGFLDEFKTLLASINLTLDDLDAYEPDAGLGNGGLGRLGAEFLDSLASLEYPAMGFSIRYQYGLFKQRLIDGWQTEVPDLWLIGGRVWLTERNDKIFNVRFSGHIEEIDINGKKEYQHSGFQEVEAIPYDMMISGAGGKAISVLRLWKSQNIRDFDIASFSEGDYKKAMKDKFEANLISQVLYPADEHNEGKTLRLKQQYFLVSASIQNIVHSHIKYYKDIKLLPKYAAIHINDTHPTLAIPELMRILIDDYDLKWDEAWDVVTATFSYTNHTILAEALEVWSEELVKRLLPRIHIIIEQINNYFINKARQLGIHSQHLQNMAIINHNQIKMANLCVITSYKVNGVSALHSEIIKKSIFNDFYKLYPNKFTNVTNGITYRKWLAQSNPKLANLIKEKIGENYLLDAEYLKEFKNLINDDNVLKSINTIKQDNKNRFAEYLLKRNGIKINPETRFDVQVKRIHEYKRQLLNALKIVYLYTELEDNPKLDIQPQTFIFGGKAAGSYYIAKQVIELISSISSEIDKNHLIKEKLNVVFIEEYNVSVAERLIPASEVSQQISLAGKEASGTGNMKFMINGALTFGTLDGANVEIAQAVGDDNCFIFGMKTSEANALWKQGYRSNDFYDKSPRIRKVINRLNVGFNDKSFGHISKYLLGNYPVSDPYMCLADFDSYLDSHFRMDEIYKDQRKWAQMSLINISEAGIFSSDRSITEYAEDIWKLEAIK